MSLTSLGRNGPTATSCAAHERTQQRQPMISDHLVAVQATIVIDRSCRRFGVAVEWRRERGFSTMDGPIVSMTVQIALRHRRDRGCIRRPDA